MQYRIDQKLQRNVKILKPWTRKMILFAKKEN